MPTAGPTILIVDDHPVLRHGLAALLQAEDWVGRIVEGSTVAEGAELAVRERPQLAVVDLGLPDGDGVELIRRIRRSVPACLVLVLTMSAEESAVRAGLNAGARGYVLKTTSPLAIIRAVQTVAEGGLVLGPGVTAGGMDPQVRPELEPPLDRLSPHEVRLLGLVSEGRSNPEIARLLELSEKTVRNRLSTILVKLGVADRVQAALLARDRGLSS